MTVFPYRQPSPRGEGAPKGRIGHWRYERQVIRMENVFAQITANESTCAPLLVDFYKGRCPKVVGIAIREKRISNIRGATPPSRCARQPLPEEGARMWVVSSVSIPPSFGRRCPQGGGWGAERSEKGTSQAGDLRKHPSAADAVPLPQWGRQISSGYAAILADGIPVRKVMTKPCIKILVEADSAMESAFP